MGVAVGAVLASGTTAGARASDAPNGGLQHIVDCFHLLLTDSAAHARECSPNTVPPWGPLVPTTGGGPNCDFLPTGSLTQPLWATQVASLDSGAAFLPRASNGELLVAGPINPCCPRYSELAEPVDGVLVASLGDFSMPLTVPARPRLLAQGCQE